MKVTELAQVKYLAFGSLYTYCCHGSKEHQIRRWLRERIAYVDSMMDYYTSQDDQVTIRMNKTGYVEFEITPYIPLYLTVKWSNASGGTQTFRVGRGETKKFYYNSTTSTDQEILIPYASQIKRLDNLSNLNPSSCILSNATKLTNVEIHSTELYNINVTNNKYLRRVDLKDCTALGTVTATGSSLNLSNCKYLRYCNVYNTALTEVQLNTSGGSLIEIYYPKTIQNVQLIKQRLLETIGLPYGNGGAEIPTSLYNIDIEECPSIKKLNTSTDNSINNTFASMVYCNNLTLRNALDLQELNFDGFHRLTKVIIENMYNLQVIGFNNLLPKGETSTIKYIGLSNCPLLETIEMNCTSNDYEITFSDGAILNFGGLLALKTITSNCVLKGIKTIVLPLQLESMFFTNEYGEGYSTIQNLWSSAVCSVNTDGAIPKATHIDSTYVGIDFASMNLKNIDLGALVNIPKAINFSLSPTTVNPHFNLNRDGETYPYLKPIGTLDLSNYTESLARFFDGVDLDKLQIVCNNNLPQTDLSYCFYNSSFSSLSAIENLLTRVSSITNLDYCFYRTTVDSLNVLNEINMGTNSTMNYTFAECPNITTLSNITISRNVTSVEGMFKGCPLTSISNITVNVAGSINGLFMGCNQLTTINTFRIPNVTDLSNVFNGCSNLTTLIGFELPSSVTNISNLFNGCYTLTTIENITFSSNITEANTWYPPYLETLQNITINSSAVKLTNCTTLTTIRDFTLGTNDCSSMFEGCTSITSDIELPSTIVNCSNMFKNCTSITHIHSNWNNNYDNGITPTDCYAGCTAINNIDGIALQLNSYTTGLDEVPTAWGGYGFTVGVTSIYKVNIPTDNYELVLGDMVGNQIISWGDGNTTKAINTHTYTTSGEYTIKAMAYLNIPDALPSNSIKETLIEIIKHFNPNGRSMKHYLNGYTSLRKIHFSNCVLNLANIFITSATNKLSEAIYDNCTFEGGFGTGGRLGLYTEGNIYFNNCTFKGDCTGYFLDNKANIIGLNNINIDEVTNISHMFEKNTTLTSIDLSSWNVPSSVTDVTGMFKNCSSLTSLNLPTWNASNINMNNMFEGCTSLTQDITIPSNVGSVVGMFKNCTSITHIHSNWNNEYNNTITSTDCYSGCIGITHVDNVPLILNEYTTALDNIPTAWGGYGFTREHTGIYKVEIPNDNFTFSFDFGGLNPSNHCFDDGVTSWGDGKTDSLVLSHTYERAGVYCIKTKMYLGAYATSVCQDFRSYMTEVIQYPTKSTNILFKNCTKVTSINVSGCVNATTINNAFYGCSALTTVVGVKDIFNSNVTSLYSCFYGCTSLITLDLSNVNISNVTEMSSMFQGCSALTELNIDNWNISNVTNMSSMFSGCTSLTQDIIIPSSVTDCSEMFKNCTSMTHIHSNWNNQYNGSITSTNCYGGCIGITHIDGVESVSGLDSIPTAWGGYGFAREYTGIYKVKIPSNNYKFNFGNNSWFEDGLTNWGDGKTDYKVFSHTYAKAGDYIIKTKININPGSGKEVSTSFKNCLTEVIQYPTKSSNIYFKNCTKVTSINVSGCINGSTLKETFSGCTNLTTIIGAKDIFNSKNTTTYRCFYNCSSLTTLDIRDIDVSNVEDMSYMFYGCSALTELNIGSWNTSKVTRMSEMFSGCTSLTSLDLSGFDVSSLEYIYNTFKNCQSMTSVNLSGWEVAPLLNMEGTFHACWTLKTLEVNHLNTKKVYTMLDTFAHTRALTTLDISNWDLSAVTTMHSMIYGSSVTTVNYPTMEAPVLTNAAAFATNCPNLISVYVNMPNNIQEIGSMMRNSPNIEDFGVLNLDGLCNLTSIYAINKDDYPTNKAEIRFRFKGKLTYDYATRFRNVFVYNSTTPLYDKFSKQTLIDLIDCLTDYSGTETIGTLQLGSINLAKLTADEILVATNKNWTLS